MIVIVDYGMGNLRSVQSKLEMLKFSATISAKPEEIAQATKLILPGVGFFAEGMRYIHERDLLAVLNKKVLEDKTPILGICLGMQLLTDHSEEGDADGLHWIQGKTRKLNFSAMEKPLRIPHVGWDKVQLKKSSILFRDIPEDERYYFTHSYGVACDDSQDVVGETEYGYSFATVVERGNIYGTQFHPEKSHKNGLKIIDNFIRYS